MNAYTNPRTLPTIGTGRSACHHGEILQGSVLDEHGRPCRALVTLPLPGPISTAVFTPEPGGLVDSITTNPDGRVKAQRAAEITCGVCGRMTAREPCGGQLRLSSEIPDGLGMGSSSADVVAAIRAVENSYRLRLPEAAVASIAVSAEHASDPLMFADKPVLFAQREGRVLERLGEQLPPAWVVGCVTGDAGVNTLALGIPDIGDDDVRVGERLRALLRRAIAGSDTALLGRVSTESARYNQRVLDKPQLETLVDIVEHVGAVGLQVAHSGTVAGLIFDPTQPDAARKVRTCLRELARNDIPSTRVFSTRHHSHDSNGDHGRTHLGRNRTPRPDPSGHGTRMPSV